LSKLTLGHLINKFNKNTLKIKPSSLILVVLPFLLLIASFSKNTFSVIKINKEIAQGTRASTALNIPTPTVVSTTRPTQTPTKIPLPTPFQTQAAQPSNNQDLSSAVNAFRSKNGLGALLSDNTLCSIAQNRINENAALGQLDNHAGLDKYFRGQAEFKSMGENLHWATYSETATEIVENGWAKSPGHLANMLDSKWQYGCGGQAGSYFASFIFGSK